MWGLFHAFLLLFNWGGRWWVLVTLLSLSTHLCHVGERSVSLPIREDLVDKILAPSKLGGLLDC